MNLNRKSMSKIILKGRPRERKSQGFSKKTISDFIFPKLDLALELNFAHLQREVKKIVDEINADIRSYSKSYSNL